MTRSSTRYTVEGCKHFDSARSALREAGLMVYVSPEQREWALGQLLKGRPVTLIYGFCSVQVTPPGVSHEEIEDQRHTVLRAQIDP